jgi:hypothetical protein
MTLPPNIPPHIASKVNSVDHRAMAVKTSTFAAKLATGKVKFMLSPWCSTLEEVVKWLNDNRVRTVSWQVVTEHDGWYAVAEVIDGK